MKMRALLVSSVVLAGTAGSCLRYSHVSHPCRIIPRDRVEDIFSAPMKATEGGISFPGSGICHYDTDTKRDSSARRFTLTVRLQTSPKRFVKDNIRVARESGDAKSITLEGSDAAFVSVSRPQRGVKTYANITVFRGTNHGTMELIAADSLPVSEQRGLLIRAGRLLVERFVARPHWRRFLFG